MINYVWKIFFPKKEMDYKFEDFVLIKYEILSIITVMNSIHYNDIDIVITAIAYYY